MMVGVVAVVDRALAQRTEVRQYRVRSRRVGRREAELDGVVRAPLTQILVAVVVRVVQDHVDRIVVGAQRSDRFQRAKRRGAPFADFDPTKEAVVANGVPTEQLSRPMRLVVVRAQPHRLSLWRPSPPALGLDREWAELVDGEGPVTLALEHVLDAGELLLAKWVRRLLPGLGRLEDDLLLGEDLVQPLAAAGQLLSRRQVVLELSDAPAGEGLSKRGRGVVDETMIARSIVVIRRDRSPAHMGPSWPFPSR